MKSSPESHATSGPSAGDELPLAVRRLIADAGETTGALGLGRVIGKIFAYLYFSRVPRCLDDMRRDLKISKGGASMGVRQLEQWEAVRKIAIAGDRKDYFEACDWFGRIVKRAMAETFSAKMSASRDMLQQVKNDLDETNRASADDAFLHQRLEHLQTFHQRIASFWDNPLVKALFR